MATYKNFNWLKPAAPKPTEVIAYTDFPDRLPSLLSSLVIQYREDLRSPDFVGEKRSWSGYPLCTKFWGFDGISSYIALDGSRSRYQPIISGLPQQIHATMRLASRKAGWTKEQFL